MNKKETIIASVLLIIAIIITLYQNAINKRELAKWGIVVRAIIYDKQYVKGDHIYSVRYVFHNKYYLNECTSRRSRPKVGDSLAIKINAHEPDGACEVEDIP